MGVASTSRKASIRVYNNKTHYNEWEFLGTPQAMAGTVILGQPAQPSGLGQNPGMGIGPQPVNGPQSGGPLNPQ